MASVPAQGPALEGRRRLGRTLPPVLGTELRSARRLPQGTSTQGEEAWPQEVNAGTAPARARNAARRAASSSHARPMAAAPESCLIVQPQQPSQQEKEHE